MMMMKMMRRTPASSDSRVVDERRRKRRRRSAEAVHFTYCNTQAITATVVALVHNASIHNKVLQHCTDKHTQNSKCHHERIVTSA